MVKQTLRDAINSLADIDSGLEAEKQFEETQTQQVVTAIDKQIEGLVNLKAFMIEQSNDRIKALDAMIGNIGVENENT